MCRSAARGKKNRKEKGNVSEQLQQKAQVILTEYHFWSDQTFPHPSVSLTQCETEKTAASRTKQEHLGNLCASPPLSTNLNLVMFQVKILLLFPSVMSQQSGINHSWASDSCLMSKFFCGSPLQAHGCLLDLKERTESGLDWKKRASQSLEGGRTRIRLWSGRIGGDGQPWWWWEHDKSPFGVKE